MIFIQLITNRLFPLIIFAPIFVGCKNINVKEKWSYVNFEKYTLMGRIEEVVFSDFNKTKMDMKIDTGAQTSSLHAFNIIEFEKYNKKYVKFKINPLRNNNKEVLEFESELIEKRKIKGTCGKAQWRPIIRTKIQIGTLEKDIEISLHNRENMEYRFLLGRQAMENILVNPTEEFLLTPKVQ